MTSVSSKWQIVTNWTSWVYSISYNKYKV